jgi:transcription elongation factor GreA
MLGFVSKESPLGAALIGHKAGDRVEVVVNEKMKYYVTVLSFVKGVDNEELPISGY